jgi:outer membrane protein TolC
MPEPAAAPKTWPVMTLEQARAALISARYDYRIARAQIESLVGRNLQ